MDPLPPPPPKRNRGRPRSAIIAPDIRPPVVEHDDPGGMLAEVFTEYLPQRAAAEEATVEYAEGEEPEQDDDLSMLELDSLRDMLAELSRRQREALRLFTPREPQRAFLESRARERVVRGGNRGGKTLVGAVLCSMCVTGKYPGAPKTDGKFVVVGKDLKHCGAVIYEKLFKPGAFKIIKDPSGDWRPYDPSLEWDAAHEDKARPAPPLIPLRYVKSIAWENKKDEIPKSVRFRTGWSLEFFSGEGAPRQGIAVDVAWFDEEIPHPLWYRETRARIIDRKGFFYWTATPQAGTLELYKLHQRALELADVEDAPVQEFHLSLLENNYLGAKEKREFCESITNEDEYRIRVEGDFALLGSRVYPEFAPRGAHGTEPFPIPADWCRYVAIDPGRQVCACLFVAVPPPRTAFAGQVFVYRELYIKRCNAAVFAERLKKAIGIDVIHGFVIDHRAGRITEIGSGKTHEQQYSSTLKKLHVACEKTGHGFTWGSDDVKAGIEAVRGGLHLDREGRSRFVFFKDSLPNLFKEMDEYSYRKLPGGVVTDEPLKYNDHLCDCLRYIAAANLRYSKPKFKGREASYTTAILKAKKERAKQRTGGDGSIRLG